MNSKTLKILIITLFAINSITLFLYFSSHPDYYSLHDENNPHPSREEYHKRFTSDPKPWPILPSYLPWSLNPNIPFRSCEAYFGNGFTRPIHLLNSSAGRGWFRCLRSDTLNTSVCEAGMIRMHPDKIMMSNGGERLESVIGRAEDKELPMFQSGAFDIEVHEISRNGEELVNRQLLNRFLPRGEILRHTMRDLIDSIRLVSTSDFHCSEWIDEPTLLATRFEYANLFHAITDWYSAYVASRVTGLLNRPHLVFVDGHCVRS